MRAESTRHRKLREIAEFLEISREDSVQTADIEITGLTNVSSQVRKGDLFLALPGANAHGSQFVGEALARGAHAVLTDQIGAALKLNIPILKVRDPRASAGPLSAWFYGEPMREMYSVGVTGTNGKTTTTTLLSQLWQGADREYGLIGTIETRIGNQVRPSARTTPESCELQELAAMMRDRQIRNFVIEVSSHALSLNRVTGSHFSAVAFTNLTQDHLDFHGSMEKYFEAKAKLFTFEYADRAFINVDDAFGARLSEQTELPVTRISRDAKNADWYFEGIAPATNGVNVGIRGPGGILIEGDIALHGEYNLDNALMAVALAFDSGLDSMEIASLLPRLFGATGRLEGVKVGQKFLAFVDYAHTPDAVGRVLKTCQSMTKGKVIAVLGCGGDRDSGKRILMGEALLEESSIAIFTSDNPRSEDPAAILAEMTQGLDIGPPSKVISDREEAIEYAAGLAAPGDLLIILGKGHEIGQEVQGVIYPFDDRQVLSAAIARLL